MEVFVRTSRNSGKPICPICTDRIVAINGTTCESASCRIAYRRRIAQRKWAESVLAKAKHGAIVKEATEIRDSTKSVPDSNEYIIIVTPVNQRKLVNLPRRRKYRFANKVARLANRMRADARVTVHSVQGESDSNTMEVLRSACSNCRGSCCLRGGDHAHLGISTIIRVAGLRGFTAPKQIIKAYCQFLPDKAYEHSCVFHTETGCALPTAMRSDACNNTICAGVSELTNRIVIDGSSRFFLAATCHNEVVNTRFAQLDFRVPDLGENSIPVTNETFFPAG